MQEASAAKQSADAYLPAEFVTAGNIVGGSLFVAIVYWIVYLRPTQPNSP